MRWSWQLGAYHACYHGCALIVEFLLAIDGSSEGVRVRNKFGEIPIVRARRGLIPLLRPRVAFEIGEMAKHSHNTG